MRKAICGYGLIMLMASAAALQTQEAEQPAYQEYVRFMQKQKEVKTGKGTIFTYPQWVQYCRGEYTGTVVKVGGRGRGDRTCRNFVNPTYTPSEEATSAVPQKPANWNFMNAAEQAQWWCAQGDRAQCNAARTIEQRQPRPNPKTKKGPRNLHITFHSDPEGATLYANNANQLFGYAPTRLKYTPEKQFRDGTGCMRLQGAMVRWASGAEMSIGALEACPQNGGEQQFVFKRPDDIPGREIDVMVALEQQRFAVMSEQARATQRAAYWQSLSAQYATQIERNRQIRLRMNCTSSVVGSYVYTNCY